MLTIILSKLPIVSSVFKSKDTTHRSFTWVQKSQFTVDTPLRVVVTEDDVFITFRKNADCEQLNWRTRYENLLDSSKVYGKAFLTTQLFQSLFIHVDGPNALKSSENYTFLIRYSIL